MSVMLRVPIDFTSVVVREGTDGILAVTSSYLMLQAIHQVSKVNLPHRTILLFLLENPFTLMCSNLQSCVL